MSEIDEAYDDRLCFDCGGWLDVTRGEPGSCTCPDDLEVFIEAHIPASLRPGEPPKKTTTVHLPD